MKNQRRQERRPLRFPRAVSDGKVRVEIVNASGFSDAGERAATMARNRGFEVASVSGSSARQKNTLIVSHTMNNAVVNKLTALPFNYILQITKTIVAQFRSRLF